MPERIVVRRAFLAVGEDGDSLLRDVVASYRQPPSPHLEAIGLFGSPPCGVEVE
jgi:hypothetical protein